MADWTDTLAEALHRDPLDSRDTNRLLLAAKDVAHRVERKQTPLAAFLVGEFVGYRMTEGASRMDALTEAMTQLHGLLPESSPSDES
ncbi:MAG: DUF6457 domain-containing protein [Actinomycetota bacterium]